jgi:hypothetical protein
VPRNMWSPQRHLVLHEKLWIESPTEFHQGVFVNCLGHRDIFAGVHTGVSYGLIGNPADIISHLLCAYGGADWGTQIVNSGFGSFLTARNELDSRVIDGFKIRFRWAQHGDLKAVIQKICDQCGLLYIEPCVDDKHRLVACTGFPSGDNYIYRATADGGPVTFEWGLNYGIIPRTLSCEPTNRDDIVNQVIVNYSYDFPTGGFTRAAHVDELGSEPQDAGRQEICKQSQSDYGMIRRLAIDADMHYLETTATWLRNWIVDTRSSERIIVNFETALWAYDLLPHHVFSIGTSVDSHMKYPLKGSDGSWGAKLFWCDEANGTRDPRSAVKIQVKGISVATAGSLGDGGFAQDIFIG